MALFKLELVETLSRTVTIEAESEEEAYEKLEDDYRHQRIVLGPEDYVEHQIEYWCW